MAQRKRPEPWDDREIDEVQGLLKSGSGAEEVCAVTGRDRRDLDWLCQQAFGERFEDVDRRFKLVGRAMFYRSLFDSACTGNAKAIDMYARMALGFSPAGAYKSGKATPDSPPEKRLEL